MSLMKRLLISLGTGIVIVFSLLFGILLAYKILFPESTIMVWLFAWPALLFGGLFPSTGRLALLVSSISIAMVFYIAVATIVVFLVLRIVMRARVRQMSSPPGPPSF